LRFAGRLVTGTILVLVIAMTILVIAADRALRADLEDDLRVSLEGEARLVRDALPGRLHHVAGDGGPPGTGHRAPDHVDRLGRPGRGRE
jgi:hypothetical protein